MLNYLKKNCHINLLFLITIIINGCAYHNIEELKSTPNISNQFSQALSESYLEFAIYEMNEMHDEIDAAYFAKKGLKARKGEKVLPELIDNWDIEHSYKVEINQKRQELIKVLNTKKANAFPILSARTQLGYDCWLEQLEEAWQTVHIKRCYDMMNSGLITLANHNINHNKDIIENVKKDKYVEKLKIYKEEIKKIKKIKKVENINKKLKFEIYFEHNIYLLNQDIKSSIKNIYTNYMENHKLFIELIGHTDRSGTDKYNILLSKLRANEVKKYLLSLGILEDNINTFYFGEKKPKIITKDGVREKINRRVEIFIDNSTNQLSEL